MERLFIIIGIAFFAAGCSAARWLMRVIREKEL